MEAALDCFLEKGYGPTTIQDIRRRSGASVGSIYHFFGSKDGLAVELFTEAFRAMAFATIDFPDDVSAREAIRLSIAGAIDWAVAHEKYYSYLDRMRWLGPVAAIKPDILDILRQARARGEEIMARYTARGEYRELPWELAHALILGPAYDYLQLRLAGQTAVSPEEATEALAEAAWQAVKGPRASEG
ncbi:MAG: TetR/AcrR family transcriptional regulator; helix-turn-helix transcriptional regulator [Deltaproteobacteria bacterium]|nr:TetR/AcrR family transcriptional regulator; helix-turn-helix transcriptional regulator [Deltaproteobacteria bacterium]